jgi:serine/threonine protein kinase
MLISCFRVHGDGLPLIGRTVTHYRIVSELGRGGMGVVYEAEDTMLGRRAALKFLPDEVAHEPHSLARFQREARAASSLNHPNICTIYEIGEEQGRWFIAMELLQGLPLDSSLAAGRVPLDKLLDWAIQVADALDAAHSHGIVHRDLKPSNVFLTKRGQLKVLDFGLAKMTDPIFDAAAATSPATASLPSRLTSPGLALGTVAFMSPEQARGEDLDARSDLFSFGTMLFQMATGRLPFDGKTTAVIFDAILNRDPVPVSELNADIPKELERIVAKCLEKDPELRYQHASELRADLKRLKRDTSSGARRGKSPSGQGPQTSSAGAVAAQPPSGELPPLVSSSRSRPSFASSEIVAAASRHRLGFAFTSLIASAILAAAVFGVYELLHRPSRRPFESMTINRLTSTGNTWAAAMSPDGKYMAMLQRQPDGRDSLWMRHLPTNSNTQIVPPDDSAILDVTFAPDGNYVYFRSYRSRSPVSDLYRVPVLGGPSALVTRDIDSSPSFTQASGRFCFMRDRQSENTQALLSANTDGSDEKVIYSGKGQIYSEPAWSPDGKRIVVAGDQKDSLAFRMTTIDAVSGSVLRFFALPNPVYEPDDLAWLPDGSGLVVVYRNIDSGLRQIAYVSYPKGEFHAITNDPNSYGRVNLSADGNAMSAVLSSGETSLDIFPAAGRTLNEKSATGLGAAYWFDWVGDDQIVLSTEDHQAMQLLRVSSGERTPVFSGSDLRVYDLDSCGPKEVVFTGSPLSQEDVARVYAVDLSGGTPRQVTSGKADQYMRCTPDGRWLIYHSFEDHGIHKISMQGGQPQTLVGGDRLPNNQFSVTPNGKEVVVEMPLAEGRHEFDFFSLETGQVRRRIPVDGDASRTMITPDGQNIGFLRRERGVDNVWLQPVTGGAPIQLTDFHLSRSTHQNISAVAWSPDGKHIAISRRSYKGDVVILRDHNP